jgi:hypothetical protein
LYSDRVQSAVGDEAFERASAVRRGPRALDRVRHLVGETRQRVLADARVAVGLLLIVGGIVWACLRGLSFYGLNPAYDADQPPLLLAFVGLWLLYRSRRR